MGNHSMVNQRYKTLVIQAFAILGFILILYKLANRNGNSISSPPNYQKLAESLNFKNNNNNNNIDLTNGISFGTDPFLGKELLIKQYQKANATIMTLCEERD